MKEDRTLERGERIGGIKKEDEVEE